MKIFKKFLLFFPWSVLIAAPVLLGAVLGTVCWAFRAGWEGAGDLVMKFNNAADWRKD